MTRPIGAVDVARPKVILYLPPGPLFPSRAAGNGDRREEIHGSEDAVKNYGQEFTPVHHVLASTAAATVVTVNYRLGPMSSTEEPEVASDSAQSDRASSDIDGPMAQKEPPFFKYPTPIHDTIAAFDWIQQTFDPVQLSVVGTHIGGSMALMLALTESNSLHAVAALEPVCDWTELDEYCTIPADDQLDTPEQNPSPRKGRGIRSMAPPDLVPLLEARTTYFHTPERYFDAFASPMLFLRSAGTYVPQKFHEYLTGSDYPIPVRKKPPPEEQDQDALWDIYVNAEEAPDSDTLPDPGDIRKGLHRRKSLSRWPPFGLDYDAPSSPRTGVTRLEMTLPWVRVYVDETGTDLPVHHPRPRYSRQYPPQRVLELQANEMVSVMRRACFWGRETGYATERVTLATTRDEVWAQDTGLWLADLVESADEVNE